MFVQRQRAVEAVNGGWAVIGLTAGLVIEGYTGKNILYQVCMFICLIDSKPDASKWLGINAKPVILLM
jgi:hypothetical protein